MPSLAQEVARRRTFAIISHPDAGKTTLTEKMLLYSGAVEAAGAVRARKNTRHTASDWMAVERERGISVSSTVLEFDYEGCRFNLLDTPGHQDFSEDTYRTLFAVDSAIMVLDGAKGIEAQTRRLYEVCRTRRIPIITFVNKMDHDALDPLELLDHVESVLGIAASPLTWPIGDGVKFQGVYDLRDGRALRFERTAHGAHRAPVIESDLADADGRLAAAIGANELAALRESVELVSGIAARFEKQRFLAGELTPVFFGSALHNFGLETLLDAVRRLAPPPAPREVPSGDVSPADEAFSGFVFKIQANLDPQHRDCMAFVRVCSGHFERDMAVTHARTGKRVRLANSQRVFGQVRETVNDAFPGDIIGIANNGELGIGDTLTERPEVIFPPIPRFQPESFARLRNRTMQRVKQFARGLEQLEQEGAIQVLWDPAGSRQTPILGAVGALQFDVVVRRLQDEYGVETALEPLPHSAIRAVRAAPPDIHWPTDAMRLVDRTEQTVLLFPSAWHCDYFAERHPGVELAALA